MNKRFKIKIVGSKADQPSDEALLDVIQSNMQRLPVNDNASWTSAAERSGFVASLWSGLGFAAIMLVGAVIMMVFKLVPQSEDSDY